MNSQVIDRIFTEIPPDMLGNGSQLLSVVGDTNTTSFIFAYNLHCANNYFGNNCSIFCIAQDDEFGHFTCHEDSGGRICLPGYTVNNTAKGHMCLHGNNELVHDLSCFFTATHSQGVNCTDVVEPCQLEPSPKNTTCSNSFVRNTCNHFTECAQPPSITSSLTPSNSLLETVPSQQQTLILPSSKLNMLSMLPDMTSENAPILLTGFASNIVASTHTSIRSTFANSAVTDTSSILLFPSSTLSPVENSMLSISINPTSLSSLVAIISETVESEQVSSLVHIFQTSSSYYASAAVNTLSSNGATSWFVRMEETSTIFLSSSNATFPSLSGSVTMTMTTIVPTSASHLSEPFPVTSSHHPLTQLSRLPHTPLPSMVGKGDGPFSVTSSSFSPLQSPWNEIVAPLLTEAGFPVTNPPSPLVQQQNSMSSSSRQINTVTVLPQLAATMSALVPSGHTIASVLSESSGSSFLPLEQLISSPLSTNQDTVSLNSVSQQAVLSQELSRQQSTAYLYIYASHSPTLMTTSSELEPTFTIYTSTPIHMLTRFPSANMTTTPTTMKSLAGNEMVTASILLPNSLLSNLFSSSTLALSSFASMGAHSSFSSIKQSFSPALKTSSPVTQSSQPLLTLARLHSESGALQATFLSQHIREVFPTITTIVSDTSNDGGMVSTTFKFQTITLSKSPPPTSQLDLMEEFSSLTGQSHSTRELSMGPSPLPQMAASNPSLHSNSKNLISTVESTMASSDIIRRSMITHSEAFPSTQISQNTISSALTMTQIVCQSLSTLSSNEGTISNHKSAVTEGTVSG